MKILLTGAGGFIGRQVMRHLLRQECELHTLDIRPLPETCSGSSHHIANLLDPKQMRALVAEIRPTHLLHLAWYVTPGKYWSSPDNVRWVQASLDLIMAFFDGGGTRSVLAGTCGEYDWSGDGILREERTPLRPATLYGSSKAALYLMHAQLAALARTSAAWGRVFYLYGPHEAENRLVPYMIRSLLAGEPAHCGSGAGVRDFLHVEDVGQAFVRLLFSTMEGPVNIGTGEGVSIADVARLIAEIIGRPELLRLGTRTDPPNDPPLLVADAARLRSLSFRPSWTLENGLRSTIEWWRQWLSRAV
jgi:nucleoside-diphosphate-sugar epimerase